MGHIREDDVRDEEALSGRELTVGQAEVRLPDMPKGARDGHGFPFPLKMVNHPLRGSGRERNVSAGTCELTCPG